jgi:hypothetical protein
MQAPIDTKGKAVGTSETRASLSARCTVTITSCTLVLSEVRIEACLAFTGAICEYGVSRTLETLVGSTLTVLALETAILTQIILYILITSALQTPVYAKSEAILTGLTFA